MSGGPSPSCDGLSDEEEEGEGLRRRPATLRPMLFTDQPDLTPLIDTNFTSQPPSHLCTPPRAGFDFGGLVERAYLEHEPPSPSAYPSPSSASSSPPTGGGTLQRMPSLGESVAPQSQDRASAGPGGVAKADWESSVWAMELRGNLIAAGRSSGKLEVSEAQPRGAGGEFVARPCVTLPLFSAVVGRGGRIVALLQRRRRVRDHGTGLPQQQVGGRYIWNQANSGCACVYVRVQTKKK